MLVSAVKFAALEISKPTYVWYSVDFRSAFVINIFSEYLAAMQPKTSLEK